MLPLTDTPLNSWAQLYKEAGESAHWSTDSSQGQGAHPTTRTPAWPPHTPLSGQEEVCRPLGPGSSCALLHNDW